MKLARVLPLGPALLAWALTVDDATARPGPGDTVCYSEQAFIENFADNSFGSPVAVDGDTVLISAAHEDDVGAVYVYVKSGTTWSQQARLQPNNLYFDEQFGISVSIDGDVAVIGAWQGGYNPYGPPGAAYVYTRTGTSWTLAQELTGSGIKEYSFFGVSVAVSGNTIAVGADYDNDVYVYRYDGAFWTERAILSSPVGSGLFGNALALEESPGGSTLVIGVPLADTHGADAGTAFVYTGNGASWSVQAELIGTGPWLDRNFGGSLALDGDTAVIGAANLRAAFGGRPGGAFVYARRAGTWSLQGMLLPPGGGDDGDGFGTSVAVEGDLVVAGAPGEDDPAKLDAGAVHVFSRSGITWERQPPVLPSGDPTLRRGLGRGVAISGETIVAGAPYSSERDVRVFVPKEPVGVAYCHCSTAHCGNPDPDAGCANSTGAGALLSAQGIPANGDVDLLVEGAIPDQFALFFEAENEIHAPFGDGYLCAYGNLIRFTQIPIQVEWDGTTAFGPCFGWPTIPEVTGVVPGSGVTKRYQLWYRDPTGPCGTGSNTTNALAITW